MIQRLSKNYQHAKDYFLYILRKFDVIVVGAGATGLSSAYHLKRENKDLKVAVIDKFRSFAQGNTGRATAGFRDLFSTDANFKLSHSTIDFYRHVQSNNAKDLGMIFTGYLFLLEEEKLNDPYLERMMKKTDARIVDKDELEATGYFNLHPDSEEAKIMNAPYIDGAFIGLNCGILEPDLVAEFYYEELRKMGVDFYFGTEVLALNLRPANPMDYPGEPFIWQEKTIGSLTTNVGEMVADCYVLCTDVWTPALLNPIGIDSHVQPKKRQVFQVVGPDIERMLADDSLNGSGTFPFTILPSEGIHFRPAPKEKSFRVSVADDIGRGFSFTEEPEIEKDFYAYNVRPLLEEYVIPFRNSKLIGGWAGHYAYNTIDMHPYIFKSLNVIVSTGTSGSGIMKADANGRVTAALYSDKEKALLFDGTSINVEDLGIKRRNVGTETFIL